MLQVTGQPAGPTPADFVAGRMEGRASVYSDEWVGYAGVSGTGRGHAAVSQGSGECARGDDGTE